MELWIINGPNLNMLGKREPEIYGDRFFGSYLDELKKDFPKVNFHYYQSNVEGEIINKLQEINDKSIEGVILNAAGYSHTSIAIADAIKSIKTPVVEVHISNIYDREEFRHVSLTGRNCKGVITGFGLESYRLAVLYFLGR